MSILDPDFLTELEGMGIYGERTLAFVKKVAKGIRNINVTVLGGVVFGSVETGDGEVLEETTLVTARAIGAAPTITVGTGTAVAGSGTANLAFTTDSDGTFSITVAGTPCALELSVDGGISKILSLASVIPPI